MNFENIVQDPKEWLHLYEVLTIVKCIETENRWWLRTSGTGNWGNVFVNAEVQSWNDEESQRWVVRTVAQ